MALEYTILLGCLDEAGAPIPSEQQVSSDITKNTNNDLWPLHNDIIN